MVLAIFIAIPSLLATWVSYWSTSLFTSLSNRASRITTLITPALIAAGAGIIVGVSGPDIQVPDPTGYRVVAALLLALTLSLILPTLVLAFIAGKLFNHAGAVK
jgi:hypothetical protein